MNKLEREKVSALDGVRLAWDQWDIRFVRNMLWLRDHDPKKTLTARQKWGLDMLLYKYRRQLGGQQLAFEIPAEAPKASDYGIQADAGAKQTNIFGGQDKPRPTRIQHDQVDPQRGLF